MAMVRLTDRQRRILVELSHACAAVTGDMLSGSLGCSKRTIQAEVSHINAVYGRRVIASTNRGYRLDPTAGEDLIDGISHKGAMRPTTSTRSCGSCCSGTPRRP